MKLPNGYGSVYKLSGKRRRPYAIAVTVKENGKNRRTIIGYAATRQEGLDFLSNYNKNPWDVNRQGTTFAEVFELWKEHNNLSANTVRNYAGKYKNYCSDLYDMPYADIRTYHFQSVLDKCNRGNGTKNIIRKLFRTLDKTAMEFDIINKEYSASIPTFEEDPSERKIFSDKEIEEVWKHKDEKNMDLVLILLYTGFRRQELADIKLKNVDLENWTIKGGGKTKAGKNRLVPIHKRIRPLIQSRIECATGENLFNFGSKSLAAYFKDCMQRLGMDHIPHECRHTLRTRLDNAGGNKTCIDMIMGHTLQGTGERVYTHKTIEQLHETIALLD